MIPMTTLECIQFKTDFDESIPVEDPNGRMKLPSVDSFDEDATSDVDDEVFIKSSKNGFRSRDKTLHKPLMAPRRKKTPSESNGTNGAAHMEIHTASPKGSPVIVTVLYIVIAFGAFAGLAGLIIFLAKAHLSSLVNQVGIWKARFEPKPAVLGNCDSLDQKLLWEVDVPRAVAGGQNVLATLDINSDAVSDIIMGFGTGVDGVPPSASFLCQLYFNTTSHVCDGGVVALNGTNGAILWRAWLSDAVTQIRCLADLDLDGIKDCVLLGRTKAAWAISSKDGKLLWEMQTDQLKPSCATYSGSVNALQSVQVITDISGDKIPDLVAGLRGADNARCPGYIVLINGYTGVVLEMTPTADHRPLAVGPALKGSGDGTTLILYASGNHREGDIGSLFMSSLNDIQSGQKDMVRTILSNVSRITGAAVSDVNGDGMEDVILTFANGTASALCGTSFRVLWTYLGSADTSLRLTALAHLNGDQLVDVAVQMRQIVNGSDVIWIAVLDGATGQVLMHLPSRPKGWDVGGEVLATKRQPGSSDIVLHWVTDLERNEARLMTSRLLGFSSHGELPSLAIYSTPTTNERQAKAKGHNDERVQLGRVIEALANRQDLRTKFSNFVRLTPPGAVAGAMGSQRTSSDPADDNPPIRSEEMEPKVIGYPELHGVRKHGRWNSRKHQVKYQPTYDYDAPPPPPPPPVQLPASGTRRKSGVGPLSWGVEDDDPPAADYNYVENTAAAAVAAAAEAAGLPAEYEADDVDARDYSRFARPVAPSSWHRQQQQQQSSERNNRRGKRIRRASDVQPPESSTGALFESIQIPPLVVSPAEVVSASAADNSADLLLAVQWTYQRQSSPDWLSSCVSQRMDQGRSMREDEDSALLDYMLDCWNKQKDVTTKQPDVKLVSAIDQLMKPLGLVDGFVTLKRVRLQCRCHQGQCAGLAAYSQRHAVDLYL